MKKQRKKTRFQEIGWLLLVVFVVVLTSFTLGKIGEYFENKQVVAPAHALTYSSNALKPYSAELASKSFETINIDPEDVEKKMTNKTKVIIPVHIGGYPCDMDPIMKLARENGLMVVEDAAHAFGGSYKSKAVGAIGDFGSFSMHEVKNINSLGEGGIVVTNTPYGEDFPKGRFGGFDIAHPIDKWLYDVVALKGKDGHYSAAGNHSSTEVQAVVLLNQLKRTPEIIDTRKKNAEYLNRRFEGVEGIVLPPLDTDEIKSTHHLYLFQIDPNKLKGDIQDFKKILTEKGVTQIPHFAPLYRFSYLRHLGYDTEAMRKTCPNAEEVFLHRFTHLPLYPLTEEQLKYMADKVIEAVEEMRR